MIKSILCAVDFSDMSRYVASYSNFLASKLNSKVYVVHVVKSLVWAEEFGSSTDFKESYEEELYKIALKKVKEFVDTYFSEDVEVYYKILKGDIVKKILSFSEDNDIDLIVIGTHGAHGIHEFIFGSVTEKILKLSKKPVFVVKTDNI